MRILYVIDSLTGGGAEKLVHDLLPKINEVYSSELLVLTLKNQKYYSSLKDQGVKITEIPDRGKNIWRTVCFIRDFIINGQFDIVHVHLFPVLYYCAFVKRFFIPNLQLVFTEHCTENRRMHIPVLRPLERYVYSQYNRVISISRETQEKLIGWLNVSAGKKFIVIENGIPLEPLYQALACKRNELIDGIDQNDLILCMIGRLEIQKNHDFMLDVMFQLPQNYKLLILGEGVLENKIREKAYRLGIEQRVFLMGFCKDVAGIIKASDMVVVPSRWEGFGLVAVEAMACGKIVVCTDVPGLAGIVGDSGIRVPLDDIEGFANAVQKIANLNKQERIEMEKKALSRARKYDINRMFEGYMRVYDQMMADKGV